MVSPALAPSERRNRKRRLKQVVALAVFLLLGWFLLHSLEDSSWLRFQQTHYGNESLLLHSTKAASNDITNGNGNSCRSSPLHPLASKTKIKMVAFTNNKFIPLARMWHNQMTELGYTEHTIVATDQETFETLTREGYSTEVWKIDTVVNPDEIGAVTDSKLLRNLWLGRLVYLLEQARLENSI